MVTAEPERLACVVKDSAGRTVAEVGDAEAVRRHALRVGGLAAGQAYTYELRDAAGTVRDAGTLATPPAGDADPVRFAFVGDSGGMPPWVWLQRSPLWYLPARWQWLPTRHEVTEIGARLAAAKPQFVLHLGDVIYPNGRNAHYSAGFFRPFGEVLRNAPYYALLGNHDVMDADGQQLLANFHLPDNARTGDERMFSFAWGAVRVICADLNTGYGAVPFDPGHPGYRYLESELAASSEPWVVVASHFPMRSASRQRDRGDLLLHLLPLLERHGVDLYLSGHDHCYQRFGDQAAGELVQIISGGGGKSLYETRPHPKAVVVESQYHWCSGLTEGRDLVIRARSLAGDLIDTVRLPLAEGDKLARIRETNAPRAARIERLLAR
jgi:hypothetical protein